MDTIYEVYFDCYGKKLKRSVVAKSIAEAKQKVLNGIVFDKVNPKSVITDNDRKSLGDMFADAIKGFKY